MDSKVIWTTTRNDFGQLYFRAIVTEKRAAKRGMVDRIVAVIDGYNRAAVEDGMRARGFAVEV